jgi:hypothetical protein
MTLATSSPVATLALVELVTGILHHQNGHIR